MPHHPRWKSPLLLSTALALLVTQTACLKTRAQLREEGTTADDVIQTASAPAKVSTPQEVQPQGAYVIDEIKGEFTRLEGRVQEIERTQQSSNKHGDSIATKDDLKKLETRMAELESAQANMIETLKKLQEAPAASASPSELLDKGKTQMEAGNHEGAVESFGLAIKNAKGKTLEEATFLRAESYFANKNFNKAIVDYSKFPEKFPKSTHLPRALFQIGKSFESQGMKDDAKAFYQELVEKFPKSPEAKKAKSKVK
jgi:TolA-binding protein